MTGLATILKQVPYFVSLSREDLEALAREVRRQEHAPGTIVAVEGEHCDALPFVIRGRVKIAKTAEDGREQVLRIIGPARTFNDVAIFDDATIPATVTAVEPTIIGSVPKARVLQLMETDPKVARAALRVLAGRLRAMTGMVEDLALRGVTARVARTLLACSHGQPLLAEGGNGACEHLTQERLATMTGSVREVVQRSLKMLESDGAIRMSRGRINVLQPAILQTWVDRSPARRKRSPANSHARSP
jgi:CRP/FNR family transcriptional regulator